MWTLCASVKGAVPPANDFMKRGVAPREGREKVVAIECSSPIVLAKYLVEAITVESSGKGNMGERRSREELKKREKQVDNHHLAHAVHTARYRIAYVRRQRSSTENTPQ